MMKKQWDDVRQPYQGIIRNLINNIDICNERYAKEGEEGYMAAREKYIKELTELKTWIKKKEVELGYYTNEEERHPPLPPMSPFEVDPNPTVLFDLHNITPNKKTDDIDEGQD